MIIYHSISNMVQTQNINLNSNYTFLSLVDNNWITEFQLICLIFVPFSLLRIQYVCFSDSRRCKSEYALFGFGPTLNLLLVYFLNKYAMVRIRKTSKHFPSQHKISRSRFFTVAKQFRSK